MISVIKYLFVPQDILKKARYVVKYDEKLITFIFNFLAYFYNFKIIGYNYSDINETRDKQVKCTERVPENQNTFCYISNTRMFKLPGTVYKKLQEEF
jgi:hypothetical protein